MTAQVYWYISKAKLDLLKESAPSFLDGVSVKLGFKLPFVSGSLSGTDRSTLIKDLERVLAKLTADGHLKNYADLGADEAPVMIRFEGPAVRHADDECFWVASEHGNIALLLAGSSAYAIGSRGSETTAHISPSADPVGAVKAAFENLGGISPVPGMSLSNRLSYVWQEIVFDAYESGATLAKVEGVAIFASSFQADRGQMRRVRREYIERLTIGTPLYVRQIS
jgi:hypothetical protein